MSLPLQATPAYSIADVPRHRQYTDAAMESGKIANNIIRSILDSYSKTITRPDFVVPHQFDVLANRLREDTFALSNPQHTIDHPALRELKGMKLEVLVPLIFSRIDREPSLWLTALPALTGASPVKARHRGRVRNMVADWKCWCQAEGYIRTR
jgi:hypothetical protein